MNVEILPDPTLGLVLQRIRLYARRRIMWLRKLWQEEGDSGGQYAVTHSEIDAIIDYKDSPEAEFQWYNSNDLIRQLNGEIEIIEAKIAGEKDSRFSKLISTFQLTREDSDLFQLCLAVKLDPSLARVYAYLHDHAARGFASEELAIHLFGYGCNSILKAGSRLLLWELISIKEGVAGEPAVLQCDPFIVQWLLGHEAIDETLQLIAKYCPVYDPLSSWPLQDVVDFLEKTSLRKNERRRVIVSGQRGSGRRTFAAVVCSKFKMRLLAINTEQTDNWRCVFVHAQRLGLLSNCGIAWYGDKIAQLSFVQNIPLAPMQFIICNRGHIPVPAEDIIDYHVELSELLISEQKELFRIHIPLSLTWDPVKLDNLVSQHRLNYGDIISLREYDVQTPDEACNVIKQSGRNKLGILAKLLECPFKWEDLVLPQYLLDGLDDFVFEAIERKQFWEKESTRLLFPQGRGLIALFSGPPGTGKTMAAQVIAARLGLDLFRIDLSAIVSKYVGETSQNLERLLSRAEEMDLVLLIDEADAICGKRTEIKDAHDRFANTDTDYLLQAIENYRGIVILSTNKKENIDNAFIRRLRYAFEFPRPDASQREQLWTKIVARLFPEKQYNKLYGQLTILANNLELTGAQIKFAVLSGAFAARKDKKPLSMSHLLRGINRELMKEGRSLNNREREKILEYVKEGSTR